MTSYSKGDVSATFTYDADGLRGSKTVNGSKTTYFYVGDQLMYECRGDGIELYFYYDSYGNLSAIRYVNGTNSYYYYVTTNSQGDVLGIYSAAGDLKASYEYDTWGNCTVVSDTSGIDLGNVNPIRYRGYYYDVETGFYYLQSRYYCPKIGRFLNSDEQLNDDIIGNNTFAYCSNNPVSRTDNTGQAWWCVIGAVVGGVAGGAGRAVSNLISGNKWYEGVIGAVAGGAVGGLIASTGHVLAAAYAGAAVEALVNEGLSYTKYAHLSGTKQKAVTGKNFVNSAFSVGIDTAVNGTISCLAGEATHRIVPKIVPDPAPMASVSFLGLETLQLSTESLWDMTLINISGYVGNQLPQKPWQTQTIQLFPDEYVEGVA